MAVPLVVIDDHRLVAGPLVTVLTPLLAEHGFAVRPLAATVAAAGVADPAGVAVCDVVLGAGLSGAAAVTALVERGWRVLLMSGYAPEEQVLDAIAAGAAGYVEKSEDPLGLVAAVRSVAASGLHLSAALAALFYADLRRRPAPSCPPSTSGCCAPSCRVSPPNARRPPPGSARPRSARRSRGSSPPRSPGGATTN
jgi:DNA-binding NarL/FixJ family response regulator